MASHITYWRTRLSLLTAALFLSIGLLTACGGDPQPTAVSSAPAVQPAPADTPVALQPTSSDSSKLGNATPIALATTPQPTAVSSSTPPPTPSQPAATEPAAAPTATPTAVVPPLPTRLRIPKLKVDTSVEAVGRAADGTMDIPKNEKDVAWFQEGSRPGAPGNAAIAGHLDWIHGPAVFYNLGKLVKGDLVYATDAQGAERKFIVTEVAAYDFDKAPLLRVFGPGETANLNLITCNGSFNRAVRNYSKRLVVYTTLVK